MAYLSLNTDVENNRWWGYDYREDVSITGPVDEDTFYDSVQCYLRHQHRWLQYPFHSVLAQGGTSSVRDYGPIRSVSTLAIFENF